ncbi:hypothetical protein COCON_G00211830 [Conger conger]|uniref:Uncharacterized protein n=1 Tax=Conger conger TaxID=82655 RepID=A0A9Q1HQV9_CONCO|nr:hypothetical protein COCON_G00211830 [Conger conger]
MAPVVSGTHAEPLLPGLVTAAAPRKRSFINRPGAVLLTGAPKEKALPQLPANETGAVYSCPINLDPTDCTRMDLVTSVNADEIVEGMWLGVTVARQKDQWGGRVLACGHRYIRIRGPELSLWRMIGKCYDQNREGLCNMGISGGITRTDVYVGTPGSFNWQGNVHVTWRGATPDTSWDSRTQDFDDLQSKSFAYMGYSVTEEKKLLNQSEYTLVTGAPRDSNRGSVTLAKIEYSSLTPVQVLYGDQVGSYFGNSTFATVDL